MAYTKLFSSIITSTIWSEDDQTRIVWITMLAIADKDGEVQGSIPGLARIAGVPVEACRSAITKFLSPDVDSRTKDDEGRRIEEIEGGWHLLNHRKYREMASGTERAEKSAIRQARFRAKAKRNASPIVTHSNAPVTPESRVICQAEADTDTDTDTTKRRTASRSSQLPDEDWLKSLESDPTYAGLNIRQELGKMQRWCAEKRVIASRARLVNWINRAERPLAGSESVMAQKTPKWPAYDAARATQGRTADEIGKF